MRTIVVYQSKTGFTERYARWIGDALSAEVVALEKQDTVFFDPYDTVIFGGGLYAGKINGIGWFKKQLPELKDKRVIAFFTGATPEGAEAADKALRKNFTAAEQKRVKVFYFQSGLAYERMGPKERNMMKGLCFALKLVKNPGLDLVSKSFDACAEEKIAPLVAYARQGAEKA